MADDYYLTLPEDEKTLKKAQELKDKVKRVPEEPNTWEVPSYSDEDKSYHVHLEPKMADDVPPLAKPRCHHLIAVELSIDENKYANSVGNGKPEKPDMFITGRCECEKFVYSGHTGTDIEEDIKESEKEHKEQAGQVVKQQPAPPQAGKLADLVAGVDQIKERYQQFERLKKELLRKSDMQKAGKNAFVKKSGWRKVATAFGLSLEKMDTREYKVNGHKVVEVTYRAHAPSGQYQDASARCSFGESNIQGRIATAKKKADKYKDEGKAKRKIEGTWAKLEHDVFATAETRAKNRAISDLVGGGEVSYEEVSS